MGILHEQPSGKPSGYSKVESCDSDVGKTADKVNTSYGKFRLAIGTAFHSLFSKRGLGVALFVGAGVGALFLFSNPLGWSALLIGGLATAAFFVTFLAVSAISTAIDARKATNIVRQNNPEAKAVGFGQMAAFKISALQRKHGMRGDNFNVIFKHQSGAELWLGALPDQRDDWSQFKGIFSFNETWERQPFGDSNPVTPDQWGDMGIAYGKVDSLDHNFPKFDDLNKAASFFNDKLSRAQPGDRIGCHCRAGVGRSAMGVAAYLIRYQNMSARDAAILIKKMRPDSTILKKLYNDPKKGDGLIAYAEMWKGVGDGEAGISIEVAHRAGQKLHQL